MTAAQRVDVRAWLDEYSDTLVMGDESNRLLVMEGFDDCIVGVGERFCSAGVEQFVVYDKSKVLAKLVSQGMTEEEAVEFHEYNQACAYHGPHTVCFVDFPTERTE